MTTLVETMAPASPMTVEQFLQLEECDDVERELIDGVVRERPMTTRGPGHSDAMLRLSQCLANWADRALVPRRVSTGDVRCRLRSHPDSVVGIDVAVFPNDVNPLSDDGMYYQATPLVAVEILSPSDTHEDVSEKIQRYLSAGVAQVWIADPVFQTITVHRPQQKPVLYNADQELPGEPELPGFRVRVASLFDPQARSAAV